MDISGDLWKMFRGAHKIKLDVKGRMKIPASCASALLNEKTPHLVATIDTQDRCLLLYPRERWLDIEEKVAQLPSLDPAARRIQRLLIGHATDLTLDNNERVLLPPVLRDFAGLERDILLVGQGNKLEVWSEAIWDEQRSQWLDQDHDTVVGLPDDLRQLTL